jgi:hypothetical protein
MIATVLGLIFVLIILGVIFWGAQQLLALIPLGEPFSTIIRILLVIVTVIICIWVLIVLLGIAGIHVNMPKLT